MGSLRQNGQILLMGLIIFICSTVTSQAKITIDAAGYLVERAVLNLESGKTERAIDSLSKALIIDPYNEEAKQMLSELGVEGGLYGPQKTSASMISDLNRKVKDYQNKIFELNVVNYKQQNQLDLTEEERDALYHLNITKAVEIDVLEKEIDSVLKTAYSDKTVHKEELAELEKHYIEERLKMMDQLRVAKSDIVSSHLTAEEKLRMVNMYREVADRNARQSRQLVKDLNQTKQQLAAVTDEHNIVRGNYVDTLVGVDEVLFEDKMQEADLKHNIYQHHLNAITDEAYADAYVAGVENQLEEINYKKEALENKIATMSKSEQNNGKYVSEIQSVQNDLDAIEQRLEALMKSY